MISRMALSLTMPDLFEDLTSTACSGEEFSINMGSCWPSEIPRNPVGCKGPFRNSLDPLRFKRICFGLLGPFGPFGTLRNPLVPLGSLRSPLDYFGTLRKEPSGPFRSQDSIGLLFRDPEEPSGPLLKPLGTLRTFQDSVGPFYPLISKKVKKVLTRWSEFSGKITQQPFSGQVRNGSKNDHRSWKSWMFEGYFFISRKLGHWFWPDQIFPMIFSKRLASSMMSIFVFTSSKEWGTSRLFSIALFFFGQVELLGGNDFSTSLIRNDSFLNLFCSSAKAR